MRTHSNRVQREARTVEMMIRRFCRDHHKAKEPLCDSCTQLLRYARHRLQKCPFQEGKTTCSKCEVHCYRPVMRDRIREVMRYVGPRMALTNPILALQHALDSRRNKPKKQ